MHSDAPVSAEAVLVFANVNRTTADAARHPASLHPGRSRLLVDMPKAYLMR
jgi:hypothetical protein